MTGRQAREPDEQARVSRAELDTLLAACDSGLRLAAKGKYYAKNCVRRRKARVEFDRFLELGRCLIRSTCPHANQGKCEVRIWITGIERYCALSPCKRFLKISFGVLGPAQISRNRQCDRKPRSGLGGVRITHKRAPEICLSLEVIRPVLPIMMEHPALVELVSILALMRERGDASTLEFE